VTFQESIIVENNIDIQPSKEKGDKCLVAIIDQEIDIFHEEFLDIDARTRILAIWDQNDQTGPGPEIAPELGTVYTQDEINECIRVKKRIAAKLIENPALSHGTKVIRALSHGTNVTSVAAGKTIGLASESQIIFVVVDRSGDPGFKEAHFLALKYIRSFLKDIPIVVNISQGFNFGAHDGTSLFEIKCDEFLSDGQEPGLVIVTSAGNQREEKRHAALKVPLINKTDPIIESITWNLKELSSPQKNIHDRIELRFSHLNSLEFRITDNSNLENIDNLSNWVNADYQQERGLFSTGYEYILTYSLSNSLDRDNVVLASIIKPQSQIDFDTSNSGWSIQIRGRDVKEPNEIIHAWIERNTSSDAIIFTSHVNEDCTLTIPATSKSIISVGAASIDDSCAPIVSNFSSLGPTRGINHNHHYQPFLASPGNRITVAIAGITAERHNQMGFNSGTSFASAYVTGAIALLLSKRKKQLGSSMFNACEVKELIINATHNHNGEWSKDIGYGVLNLQQLLNSIGSR
jgi:minor extracellular serine protease Vpr